MSTIYWVSLHTADPSGGDQTTHEIDYLNYRRVSISDSDFVYVGDFTIANKEEIIFPEPLAGKRKKRIITHFAIGTKSDGRGRLIRCAKMTNELPIENWVGDNGKYVATIPCFGVGAFTIILAEFAGGIHSN